MACPQCEDGYTKIANELFEAIIRADFDKRELKVLLAVIRQTYGYGKKDDLLSASRLEQLTGIEARNVRKTVSALVDRGVLNAAESKGGKVLSMVKDWERWGRVNSTLAREGQNDPRVKTTQGQNDPSREGGEGQNDPSRRVKTTLGEGQIDPTWEGQNDPTQKKVVVINTPPLPPQGDDAKSLPVVGGGGEWIFPKGMGKGERAQASRLFAGIEEQAQDLLDELAALMAAGKVKVAPLSLLRGLANRAKAGEFVMEQGWKVRKAREVGPPSKPAAQGGANGKEAVGEDTLAVLRSHARLRGSDEGEYLRKFGVAS